MRSLCCLLRLSLGALLSDALDGGLFKKSLREETTITFQELKERGIYIDVRIKKADRPRVLVLRQGKWRRYLAQPLFKERTYQKDIENCVGYMTYCTQFSNG